MKAFHFSLALLFFLCLALLLSFSFQFWNQIPGFDIQHHTLNLKIWPLFTMGVLICLFLLGLWMGFSRSFAGAFSLPPVRVYFPDLLSFLPLGFLLLLPLALTHYLDADDLLARVKIFLGTILFGLLYLKAAFFYQLAQKRQSVGTALAKKISSLHLKKKLLLLFLTALILYNAGSVLLTSSGHTFSGDEPHYLLISHSLLTDGDINLADDYADRDYQHIMQSKVRIRPHTAPGTSGRYSFHSPGTSLLLLPFYAAGSLFGDSLLIFFIRFGMSVVGALLGVQIFLYILQQWRNEKTALTVWTVYGLTSPVFFYSLHVYPEIIAALLSLTVFRLLRFSDSFSKPLLVLLGFLLSCFIWFHAIKYVFLAAPLFLYAVWHLIRKQKVGWNILYFLSVPFFLTLLYFVFQYTHYGSLSLSSVSWRGALNPQESWAYFKTIVSDIPFRVRWESLAGYFFDQRDGLLLYAPVYFFAFLGLVEMARRNLRHLWLLLFLTAPYVLNSAFLTQRTGYAPQARPLVAVSWAMAIAVGFFLACNAKKIFSLFFSFAAFLSFCTVLLLLKHPDALYQLTTVGTSDRAGQLFLLLSNLHFYVPKYLPSYLKIDNTMWLPNYAWGIGLLFFIGFYIALKKHSFRLKYSTHILFSSIGIGVVFVWLVLFPKTVLQDPVRTSFPTGHKVTFYSIGRVARMSAPGTFHLPEDNRWYVFYFTSWRKIQTFRFHFGSKYGLFDVKLKIFDVVLFNGTTANETKTVRLPSPPSYRLKNVYLYRMGIFLEKKSGPLSTDHPFVLSILPLNRTWGRSLGP